MKCKGKEDIGRYFKQLIEKSKYKSARQFGKACLELEGKPTEDADLNRKNNQISQITLGNKDIQIQDLIIFADVLGVSCEEILSAGEYKGITSGHVTNYEVACSKDPAVWEKHINREDKLILNSDEYCKTIIDYAIEFKNFEFIKYLIDNGCINIEDISGWKDGFTFGATTSIECREPGAIDRSLPFQLQYQDSVRTQLLVLAIENGEYELLDRLKAREVPYTNSIAILENNFDRMYSTSFSKLNAVVAVSDDECLEYFGEEFTFIDNGKSNVFIYPFIGKLIDTMLEAGNSKVEILLRKSIEHNRKIYREICKSLADSYEGYYNGFLYPGIEEKDINDIKIQARTLAINKSQLYIQENYVSYFYTGTETSVRGNIVHVEGESNDKKLQASIFELNDIYDSIMCIMEEWQYE